jgi:hypothetical protein
MWYHMWSTTKWLLCGACSKRRAVGEGLATPAVFPTGKLWTSGSLVAHALDRAGYDVTRACGTSVAHFRNSDFLKLAKTRDFVRS